MQGRPAASGRPAAYRSDLAYVHDAGFGEFARRAAPGILRRLERAGVAEGLVVDVGCGSGILAEALIEAGYEVIGVDQSEAMLRLARQRAPGARFVRSSFLDLELPGCSAVTAVGECFSYGFDSRVGRRSVKRFFTKIHRALPAGGLLIFDVVAPGREPARVPRRTWHDAPDWTLCLEASEDPAAGILDRHMTVFRKTGSGYRRSDEHHRLWLYGPDDALADLRSAGFEAQPLRGYGSLRFQGGHAGFVATKPP